MTLKLKNRDASQQPHNPGGTFTGIDWSNSIQRPGCQGHLKYPSRRGDELVMHKPPMGMQPGNPRGGIARLVLDLQRIHKMHDQ